MRTAVLAVLLALAPIATGTVSAQTMQPAPDARTVAPRPMERGTYSGLSVIGVNNALRAQLQIARGMGLSIVDVRPGSPAAKAGLMPNDVLVKLDDQLLVNPAQFVVLVRNKRPGNQIELTVIRQGKSMQTEITLGEALMVSIEEEAAIASRAAGRQIIMQGGAVYDPAVSGDMANASEVTFRDELYDITVKIDASALPLKKNVTVRDVKSGQVVFNGNINTPEERAALRSEYVDRLKQMKMW